ncbi:MAG: hypothetical protein UT90_C0008G0022 [Parcubacteria group bacterium GW2011_GWA1_40_21]|nr:MAG: hypothetical protein UT80_C0011G0013 [Parcubacteria group bacterium GW2011_GWC1_40_13]KKR53465.1 MAG: hypothetical protein UT90_C0008G0022 [Parcubacteria group bacterium GW2011_GWA1_40_21]
MNKSTKNKSVLIAGMIVLSIIFSFYFQPVTLFALDTENNGTKNDTIITLDNPLGNKINNLPSFIYMILELAFQIGAIFSVLAIIYVGFLFVSARGDPEKLKTARTAFLYTVIGIAVLLGAVLIATVIQSTISNVSTGIYQ